jgi:hypothetical protein
MELDFYLVEKLERDPWAYAVYHCGTGANMYSRVHWSYFPTGAQGERLSSRVLELTDEVAEQAFGHAKQSGTGRKAVFSMEIRPRGGKERKGRRSGA